jgi:hypothetical protein
LAGRTPEEASDAFLNRIRVTLSCIAKATAYASPAIPEQSRSLTLYAEGQSAPGRIRLSTHGGQGELFLRLAHAFTTERIPDEVREQYVVKRAFYQFRVLDYGESEIVVYDWHPAGASPATAPHLHISAVRSIRLEQRPGSPLAGAKTYLGDLHFPTGRIVFEDIVELLIREFSVDPLRNDWERVLRENREIIEREPVL